MLPDHPNRTRIFISFACVYLFWGSTYLAMRFGVQVLPPFVLGAARFAISGPLLLGICLIRRVKVLPSRRELGLLALIGILMLGGGNTAVIWAEQFIPSGLAALLVASIPLYAALIEVLLPHGEGLPARGWFGIAIGFAGLLLLLEPSLRNSLHGDSREIVAVAVTLFGSLCWTIASILSRRTTLHVSGFAAAGWQMVFAAAFNGLILLATRGWHGAHWGAQAWSATLYLVVFGSTITYTAYIYLLDHVAVSKVATYAYINPIIAVVLGAIFLHERLATIEFAGMAAILAAVYLVTSSRMKSPPPLTLAIDEDLAAGQI